MNEFELFAPPERFRDTTRWFTRLRFAAVAALAVGVTCDAVLTEWSDTYGWMLGLAGAVFALNVVIWFTLRRDRREGSSVRSCWIDVGIDLAALTALVTWTGGVESPLVWLFLLYLVAARLTLPLHRGTSYLLAFGTLAFLGVGLWISGDWPTSEHAVRTAVAWLLALGVVVLLADRLTRMLHERETGLDQQRSLMQAILDTAVDGIITIDRRGTILRTNPAADRIFGYERGELIGQNVHVLMPEPYKAEHDGYLDNYLRTGVPAIIGIGRELDGTRRDGTIFPMELAVGETRSGDLHLFTGVVRDVTERRAADRELRDLHERLLSQREAMIQHEKMVAVGQLAAGVVHEIANPLACMDSVIQLAMRNGGSGDESNLHQSLQTQIERMRKTMSEMSSFVHPNEMPLQRVDVNDLVQGAINMVRFDHRIRKVEVNCRFGDDVGEARMVPNAVQQVLVNILLNAVDAVDGVTEPRIDVRTSRTGRDRVNIEVADNGTGIPTQNLERIYDPFFTTKPPGRGTGLGLSICYRLVTQMLGTIGVTSDVGTGSRFRLQFPRNIEESDGRETGSSEDS